MRSQSTIRKRTVLWSVAQYNSNNSWLYNGNNGNVNNNNKYNNNGGRSLVYDVNEYKDLPGFRELLNEMYDAFYECRRTKRSKSSTLEFEYKLSTELISLAIGLYNFEYIPKSPIAFLIFSPRIREVIAANFSDRVVQTWYASKIKHLFEKDWFDYDSYSCRKGKGGLKAAQQLQKYIYEESCGYVKDVWIVKRDIRACFMSVDTEVLERELDEFIMQNFGLDENLRNRLLWLTRIIYRSLPQNHCIIKGNRLAWGNLEPRKSMFGKTIGIPIGNKTSQDAVLFITSMYLSKIREMGYKFCHYTDDTAIVVKDLVKWKEDEKEIERYISDVLHLEWHKDKKYVQHFSKGVEFLGYKIRYDRIFPSDRIAHNFNWKAECAIRRANDGYFGIDDIESFMETFNSYTGLLKWCNAHRIKNAAMSLVSNSKLSEFFDIHGDYKITIKKNRSRKSYFMRQNRKRKLSQKQLSKTLQS